MSKHHFMWLKWLLGVFASCIWWLWVQYHTNKVDSEPLCGWIWPAVFHKHLNLLHSEQHHCRDQLLPLILVCVIKLSIKVCHHWNLKKHQQGCVHILELDKSFFHLKETVFSKRNIFTCFAWSLDQQIILTICRLAKAILNAQNHTQVSEYCHQELKMFSNADSKEIEDKLSNVTDPQMEIRLTKNSLVN